MSKSALTKVSGRKFANIVFVEDNIYDIEYIKWVLKINKVIFNLYICRDGIEILDLLYKRGLFFNAESPDLIFLDLALPKLEGAEILKIVKNDPTLKSIPISILSGSTFEEDATNSYHLGAQFYINKPFKIESFFKIIDDIKNIKIQEIEGYLNITNVTTDIPNVSP